MRICAKANQVFKAIENICRRNPDMTLKEALHSGLLSGNLRDTQPLILGEFTHVHLNNGYEKN